MCSRRPMHGIHLSFLLIGHAVLAIGVSRVVGPPDLFGAENRPPSQSWALLIGVDAYDDSANLPALGGLAGADQRDLAAQLVRSGFPEDQVVVVHDDANKGLVPFKANIERQLELLLDPAQGFVEKGDLVIVGFSGHGVSPMGTSYLCPTDAKQADPAATMIPLENIYQQLDHSRAALKLLVVDACRGDPARAADGKAMSRGFAASLGKPPRGLLLLTSCGEGQVAFDEPSFGHGVFMHFMLDGLAGKAANEDGDVTVKKLYAYAGSRTKKYVSQKFSRLQTPALAGKIDDDFKLCRIDRNAENGPDPVAGKVMTNSIGMKLALIPAGEFLMGSDETKEQLARSFELYAAFSNADEQPKHRVRITRPYYLGIYEVTRGEFGRFVEATSYQTDAEKDGKGGFGWDEAGKKIRPDPKFTWRNPGFLQADEHPVVNVSHSDALAFCEWLSKKEGKRYRLPTEAEWEYACRAGTTTRYANGDDPEGLAEVGNVADGTVKARVPGWTTISARDGYMFTAPVGQFQANAFGLYDMHGNVWEWCSDWYGKDYYANSPGSDPQGPDSGTLHVDRGGGWYFYPVRCRSSDRDGGDASRRFNFLGFRVCLVP